MSISVRVDMDIDPSDIYPDDIVYLVEDKIDEYRSRIRMAGDEKRKQSETELSKFISDLSEAMGIEADPEVMTIQDKLYKQAFDDIKKNFTLEEVQTFLNTKK